MLLLHSHIARSFGNRTVWLTLISFFVAFLSEFFFVIVPLWIVFYHLLIYLFKANCYSPRDFFNFPIAEKMNKFKNVFTLILMQHVICAVASN